MSLVIRNATPGDFAATLVLFGQLWPGKELHEDILKTVFIQSIQSAVDEYLCAELDGKVVGFCSYSVGTSLWQEGRMAYIHELVVDGLFRGRGLGEALLTAVINRARAKGCRKIELDSAFHREKAHAFYEKSGFLRRAYLFSRDL